MANEKNLVPINERTKSEQREIASAGGKASGAARRRKKSLKQKMQLLLSLPAADNDQTELANMGVNPEDIDNEMVLVKALFLAALKGIPGLLTASRTCWAGVLPGKNWPSKSRRRSGGRLLAKIPRS